MEGAATVPEVVAAINKQADIFGNKTDIHQDCVMYTLLWNWYKCVSLFSCIMYMKPVVLYSSTCIPITIVNVLSSLNEPPKTPVSPLKTPASPLDSAVNSVME